MGSEWKSLLLCHQHETRKCLLLLLTLLAAISLFQYFKLPNGDFFSSIIYSWKITPQQLESTKSHQLGNFTANNSAQVGRTKEHILALEAGPDIGLISTHESPPPITFVLKPFASAPKSIIPASPPPPTTKKKSKKTTSATKVYNIREMDELLIEGRRSIRSVIPLWPSKLDEELVEAKLEIEKPHPPLKHDGLNGVLYRDVAVFQRSYELMERTLKVYVYKEGNKPVFHEPILTGIYASEGWFMKLMESSKQFITKNPEDAHLFYIPFSSQMLRIHVPKVPRRRPHSNNLVDYMKDYLDTIVSKYPFWNRTRGADHFLVACHDWAASVTRNIMSTCVRALCDANVYHGFAFGKDISLPETNVLTTSNPSLHLGGKSPSERKTLAFFAGRMHGYLRPIILYHWQNSTHPDIKVFERLLGPKPNSTMMYVSYMQDSKYCICPRGYEVNSPRVVEAILYECVPVIISDNFVPPFFDILNWDSFAIFVVEKDVPKLRQILVSIPEERYLQMYERVKEVQRHFLWHHQPVKYDLFHMILHSVWYNRVFQFRHR